jgi:NADPH:quinone reductase-like Zn-dependent oxidoreductase
VVTLQALRVLIPRQDVLVSTGILQLPETYFGHEAAGIVTRLGPAATKLSVGDRVMLVGHKTFASSVVQSEMLCEKIPDSLDMLQAAASPLVFLTAIYGLLDMGRLEEGQVSQVCDLNTCEECCC